ncbi:mCG1041611, partial [Mus musculus]
LLNVIKFNIRSHFVIFDYEKQNVACTLECFIYYKCLVDQPSPVSGKGICFLFFPIQLRVTIFYYHFVEQ